MRIKRLIALWMLVIYLLAVGLPAYASITCHCVVAKAATEHLCCTHCNHDDSVTGGRVHVEAPCCADQHSTHIELYTHSIQDNEKNAKRVVVIDLQPALVVDVVVDAGYKASCCGCVYCVDFLFIPYIPVSSCGLRAPPALV